jgi:prepilin-type N-terminal cleavage/methylation domain-containing protein
MKRTSGFTLMELLVVIAIIGVLAGLLGSAVAKAQRMGKRIECINKLRQWGVGAQFYAEDHNDNLPQEAIYPGINTWEMTAFTVCGEVWYNSVPKSLGVSSAAVYSRTPSSQRSFYSQKSFFHCPAAKFATVAATYPNFSLAMNTKLIADYQPLPDPDAEIAPPGLRLSEIVVPAKTALIFESGVPGEKRLSQFQMPYSGAPKGSAAEFSGRHGNAGNILFAAGNVATFKGREVLDLDPNSPRRGGAIFPPTGVIWRHDPALAP